MRPRTFGLLLVVTLTCAVTSVAAQQAGARQAGASPSKGAPAQAQLPAGYVIGPTDVLSITFWRDKDLSAEALTVRPDGMISLPLLNEIKAAGLTPEQLRGKLLQAAG